MKWIPYPNHTVNQISCLWKQWQLTLPIIKKHKQMLLTKCYQSNICWTEATTTKMEKEYFSLFCVSIYLFCITMYCLKVKLFKFFFRSSKNTSTTLTKKKTKQKSYVWERKPNKEHSNIFVYIFALCLFCLCCVSSQ